MNTIITNWKTTLAGIGAGLLLAALGVYKPGMTVKQWAAFALVAATGALPGILAHDGFVVPNPDHEGIPCSKSRGNLQRCTSLSCW